jgi:tellurite resistance protein
MAIQTEHRALIYVMVLVSAADNEMTDRELFTIGEFVRVLPVFRDFPQKQLPKVSEQCADILAKDGLDAVIDYVAKALPEHLRETAYVLACDVAAVEGRLRQEEIKLLEFLRHRVGIGRLPAAAIERAAKARFQPNKPRPTKKKRR